MENKPVYKYINGMLVTVYPSLVEAGKAENCNRFSLKKRIEGSIGYRAPQSKDHLYFSYSPYEEFNFEPKVFTKLLKEELALNNATIKELREKLEVQAIVPKDDNKPKKQSFWKNLWNKLF